MFRSASQIDSERTASSLRRIKANWERTADSWFTGSVDSIDRRIALCERLIHQASQATGRLLDRPESGHYMKLAHDLLADHEALTQMRRDLLTAAVDRDPDLYKFASEKPCEVTVFGRPLADMNPDDANYMRGYLGKLGGCMNTKPGSSGKPVSCGCGRIAMKRNARGDGRDEREVTRSRPYNDPVFSRGNPFPKARSESSLLQHEFDESDGGQSCGAPSEDEPGAICGWERSEHIPSKRHARWIELEARKFMADNEDAVSDLHELRTRAANFAALKTSTLPVDQHRAIVAGFVARVNDLGRRIPKRTAARKVAAVNDFPDALMFID